MILGQKLVLHSCIDCESHELVLLVVVVVVSRWVVAFDSVTGGENASRITQCGITHHASPITHHASRITHHALDFGESETLAPPIAILTHDATQEDFISTMFNLLV
jgi:hypothetical protein